MKEHLTDFVYPRKTGGMARSKNMAMAPAVPPAGSGDSDSDGQGDSDAPLDIRSEVLDEKCEELRSKLVQQLKDSPDTHEDLIQIAEPYGPAICQRVLPCIIGGIMEKSEAQQKRAKILRRAVQSLEKDHHFEFVWNEAYQCFFEQRVSKRPTPTTPEDAVKRVFGDDYERALELNDGRRKLSYLKPLSTTCESLNLNVETVRHLLAELKEERVKKGKQGTSKRVTIGDINRLNKQLRKLVEDTSGIPKIKDLAKKIGRVTKRQRLTNKGKYWFSC